MKIAMLTTLVVLTGLGWVSVGHASGVGDYGAMVQGRSPACALGVPQVERTATLARRCCDGVACSQMLATTKIDRPRALSHT